jgi:hypothetical protein
MRRIRKRSLESSLPNTRIIEALRDNQEKAPKKCPRFHITRHAPRDIISCRTGNNNSVPPWRAVLPTLTFSIVRWGEHPGKYNTSRSL